MEPAFAPITLVAPAKLTVSLRVLGVRADGYHLIDAEMVSLDLADTLILRPGHGIELRFEPPAREPAVPDMFVPDGEDNLVARALVLVGRQAAVHLTKRIPPGAGLGGGSADAAAILRWAGVTDPAVAVGLGADVAFCLANGRARVTGIGEKIQPLVAQRRIYTLGLAPFGCSTAAVYQRWDRLGGPRGGNGNDLEAAALAVEPRLARCRDKLHAASGLQPRLAGSGSTWFVEGAFPGEDRIVATTSA